MKKFKQIDLIISIALIIIFLIYGILSKDFKFITGYFVVGGWQVISMLVHQFNHWFIQKGSSRLFYHNMVVILIAVTAFSLLIPLFSLVLLFFLLFAAPVMAVMYSLICYNELSVKMQRPLALLK
ncbi:MAG: hypothetical protein QM687_05055 [Ferruginibacter sp.]